MNTYIFISNVDKGSKGYRTDIVRSRTMGSALVELKQLAEPVEWGDIDEVVVVYPDGLVEQNRDMQNTPQVLTHSNN